MKVCLYRIENFLVSLSMELLFVFISVCVPLCVWARGGVLILTTVIREIQTACGPTPAGYVNTTTEPSHPASRIKHRVEIKGFEIENLFHCQDLSELFIYDKEIFFHSPLQMISQTFFSLLFFFSIIKNYCTRQRFKWFPDSISPSVLFLTNTLELLAVKPAFPLLQQNHLWISSCAIENIKRLWFAILVSFFTLQEKDKETNKYFLFEYHRFHFGRNRKFIKNVQL